MGTLTVKGGSLSLVGGGTPAGALDKVLTRLGQAGSRAVRTLFTGTSTTQATPGYVSKTVADLQATYGGSRATVVSPSGTWGTLSTAAGIQGFNSAIGGTNADTFLTDSLVTNIGTLAPDVIFMMSGTNDFGNDRPPATFKSDMAGWIAKLKTAVPGVVVVLLHTFERYQAGTRTYPWAAYGTALRELAAADPTAVAFLDLGSPWYSLGLPSTDPANLVNKSDLPHPTQAGHDLLWRSLRLGLRLTGLGPVPADTTAPSTPTALAAGTPTSTSVPLSWTASTDNVAVTGYRVRRGGTLVGSPTGTTFTDTGLTAATSYSYTVSAVDAAGNESAQTSAVSVTTAAAGGGQTTLLSDDFNRADGTIGTATTGQAWQQTGGTYTVSSNRATGTAGIATIDVGTADTDTTCKIVYGVSKANAGITFRAIDANNRLSFYLDTVGGLQLGKTTGGTTAILGTGATGLTQTDGTVHTLRIVAKGNQLTGYLNGTQVVSYTLTTDEMTTFGAVTKVGLRQGSTAATFFDDFVCKTAA